jgi:predicted AAA+ superfamily ATPase
MLSKESVARDVDVSAHTITSWLSIPENSFIIHFLEPDSNNPGRTVVKPRNYILSIPGCFVIYCGWKLLRIYCSAATKEPS